MTPLAETPRSLLRYLRCKDVGVPPRRIKEIVKGKRSLTVDTALRHERYFAWPAVVWLNLQSHHDPQTAKASLKSDQALRCEKPRTKGMNESNARSSHTRLELPEMLKCVT